MPLKSAKSEAAIQYNIAHLRGKGYPEAQAVAISYKKAGKSKKTKKDKK